MPWQTHTTMIVGGRNSTLTWLLKDSLGGNSKTVMLATISPVVDSYQETMSTLRHVMVSHRYVVRAKDIVNIVSPNEARTNPLVGKLREEIRTLKEWLKWKDSLIVEHKKREALVTKVLQRTHAACDERTMRAIADNAGTQEALRIETQKRSDEAAAAAEALNRVEQRHQQNLQLLVECHREALTISRRTSEENVQKAREESAKCMQQLIATQKSAHAEVRRLSQEVKHAGKKQRSESKEFGLHETEISITQESAVGEPSTPRADTAETTSGEKMALNSTVAHGDLEAVKAKQPINAAARIGSFHDGQKDEAQQVTDGSEQEAHEGLSSPWRGTQLDTVEAVGQAASDAVCDFRFQRRVGTPSSEQNEASQEPTGAEVKGSTGVRAITKEDEVSGVKLVVDRKDEPDSYSDPESVQESTEVRAITKEDEVSGVKFGDDRKDEPGSYFDPEWVQGSTEVRAIAKEDEVSGVKFVVDRKDEFDSYSDPKSGLGQDRISLASVQGQPSSPDKVLEEQYEVTPPLECEANRSKLGTIASRQEHNDQVHASVPSREIEKSLTVTTAEKVTTNEAAVETTIGIASLSGDGFNGLLEELGKRRVGTDSNTSAVEEGETTDLARAVIRLAQTPLEVRANAISASMLQGKLHQDGNRPLRKGLEVGGFENFQVNEEEIIAVNTEAQFVVDFKAVQEEAILPMKKKNRKTTQMVEPYSQVVLNERKQPTDVERHEQDFEATSMECGLRSSALPSTSDSPFANKEEAMLVSELKESRRDDGMNIERYEVENGRRRMVDIVGVREESSLSILDTKGETAQSIVAFRDESIRKRASQGEVQIVNTTWMEEGLKSAGQCLTEREILAAEVGTAGDSLGTQHSHEFITLHEKEVERSEACCVKFEMDIWKERVKAIAALTALEASHRMALREIKARYDAEIFSLRAMLNKRCSGEAFPYTLSDPKEIQTFSLDVSEQILPEHGDFTTVGRTLLATQKRLVILDDDCIVLSMKGRSMHEAECGAGRMARTTRESLAETGDHMTSIVGHPQNEHGLELDRTSEVSQQQIPMVSSKRTGRLPVINIVDSMETVGKPNGGYTRTPEAGLATHVSSKAVPEGGRLVAQDTKVNLVARSIPPKTIAASAENDWQQLQVQEEMHGTAWDDADQRVHERMEACLQRAETAEAVAKEYDALYKEALASAEVLEDTIQSSPISREQELADLRTRVVQLEAFFARQMETTATGSSESTALSLRQRLADLRALAVCTTRGLGSGDAIPLGTGEFAFGGLPGDLPPEQYVGELENNLVRTTLEAAAARQDHLEADQQLNSLTKQLAGLKVIQAQLRERLEDAQMKLHHRSKSIARRWFASAARLARNFARPDRHSMSSFPPRVISEMPCVKNTSPCGRSSSKPTSGSNGAYSPPPFKRVSSLKSTIDLNTRS